MKYSKGIISNRGIIESYAAKMLALAEEIMNEVADPVKSGSIIWQKNGTEQSELPSLEGHDIYYTLGKVFRDREKNGIIVAQFDATSFSEKIEWPQIDDKTKIDIAVFLCKEVMEKADKNQIEMIGNTFIDSKFKIEGEPYQEMQKVDLSSDAHIIPPLDNTVKERWLQPDRFCVFMDNNGFAVISVEHLVLIPTFESHAPSLCIGKMWKVWTDGIWELRWYTRELTIGTRPIMQPQTIIVP